MAKVFISYTSQDRPFVADLAENLKRHQVDVWWDEWEIGPGDSLVQKIQNGISAAAYLLVVLSPLSVQSRWVQEELSSGIIESHNRDLTIIPILLEGCKVPPFLAHRRYVNFSVNRASALTEILQAIKWGGKGTGRQARWLDQKGLSSFNLASVIVGRYAEIYANAPSSEKANVLATAQDVLETFKDGFRLTEEVFPHWVKICIEQKRLLLTEDFLDPDLLADFIRRNPEAGQAIVVWTMSMAGFPIGAKAPARDAKKKMWWQFWK